ncbi:MAG: Hsp20/alpha crystallin family protein [Christensenellales bacterium]
MTLIPFERHLRPFGIELFRDFMDNGLIMPAMKANIKEKEEAFVVEAEIPGVRKEDIEMIYEKGVLTISAKTSEEKNKEDGRYIRKERITGEFMRRFVLKDIEEEKISAKLEDGMLYVTLPKKEKQHEQKRIEIE